MLPFRKPIASALKIKSNPRNEVTVTIIFQDQKMNYHETFLMDLAEDNQFVFDGDTYEVPAADTLHYRPSFWAFDKKLAMFYEVHATLAHFFDWFGFRKKAVYEVGYIYEKGQADPLTLESDPDDWAMINYHLQKNTTVEAYHNDADNVFRKHNDFGKIALAMVLIVAIVAVMVTIVILTGHNPANIGQIQNVTAPTHTLAPPIHFITPRP